MGVPTREEAQRTLENYVQDEYQRYHARMVAAAMEGYGELLGEDPLLWCVTGLLHDLDFEKHLTVHPGESLKWFKEWGYPQELIHAVEAHAFGYNGFTMLPQTKLAACLMARDELCSIFYAYRKLNPIPYGQMKVSSIMKRLKEKAFAAKIERATIYRGCEALGVPLEKHIENLTGFFSLLP